MACRVESPGVLSRPRGLSADVFGLCSELQIIPSLCLGRWGGDGIEQALVIESGHPLERRQFNGLDGFPGRSAMNQFRLVKTVDGFGQCIVVAIPLAADRGFPLT